MKRLKLGIAGIAVFAVILAFACQNPFDSGLGSKPDILPPGISVTEGGTIVQGGSVKGTVTITGVCSDDRAVDHVAWKFKDVASSAESATANATLDASGASWSITINTATAGALYADGLKRFQIDVYDQSGKSTQTFLSLMFDNTAPVAMVTSPASEVDAVNGTITVNGTAYDIGSGISAVAYSILNSSDVSVASGACSGTTNWFFNLDTKTVLTATTGNYKVVIVATDGAGNKNIHQYLYSDIFAANANSVITAGQLAQIEGGATLGGTVVITPANIGARQKASQALVVNQDSDRPTFEISSPASDETIGLNSKVVGIIYDDDAVDTADPASIQFAIFGPDGTTVVLDWTNIYGYTASSISGSGISVRFAASLVICTGGDYYVQIRAKDIYGTQGTSAKVHFKVDPGIPTITITDLPMDGADQRLYYSNTETIAVGGTASSGGQVNSITVEVSGYPNTKQTLTGFTGQNTTTASWNCNLVLSPGPLPANNVPEGKQTIIVTAIDTSSGAAKSGTSSAMIFVDNTNPSANLNSPPDGTTVYGSVTLRGSTSDNNRVTKVELLVGKRGLSHTDANAYVELTGNLYDWTQTFMSNDFANALDADISGSSYDLPITVRVTDVAHNVNLITWHLLIDLDRDKPSITIQTPSADVNTAGTVIVSGSCYDENPGVGKVFMKVEALKDDFTSIGFVNPVTAAAVASSYAYEVPWQGTGRTYWQRSLNDSGLLYDVCAAGAAYEGLGPHNGWLRVTVWPQDGNGKDGNASTIRFRLDDSIPRIENVQLTLSGSDVAASDYLYAKGTIHVKATLRDDVQVNSIKISFNGGSNYSANLIGTKATGSGALYTLDYDINTVTDTLIPTTLRTAANGGSGDGSGLLTVGIKVEDNSSPAPYTSTYFVTLNLDNKAPDNYALAGTSETIGGGSYLKVTGSSALLEGYSTDMGNVGGVSKVFMYLTDPAGTTVYDPKTGTGVAIGTVTLPTDIYPANSAGTGQVHYVIGIDSLDEKGLGDSTGDKDGFNESLSSGSTYNFGSGAIPAYKWSAVFNSTVFADDAYTVHFVTYDIAGNVSTGTRSIFIANKAPTIAKITLGTDVDDNGNASGPDGWEKSEFTSGYAATGFVVQNYYFWIKTDVDAGTGNGALTYSVKFNGTEASSDTSASTAIVDGAAPFGTIGITDSAAANDRSFTVRVTDSKLLYAEIVVGMTMDNVDSVPARIDLLQFGSKYNSLGNSVATSDYADCVGGTSGAWTGHVEVENSSVFDGTDPDVSGVIKVKGKAYDDRRLGRISCAIPGFDPDGTGPLAASAEFDIATWNGSAIVGNSRATTPVWSCAIETDPAPSLSLGGGHAVYFTFTWNTADISARVAPNLGMRFRAYDKPENVPVASEGDKTLTVDVVPYISKVSTQAKMTSGGIKDVNIRAASGKYSVKSGADGSFITVSGFNLNPCANGVRLTQYSERTGLTSGGGLAGNAMANGAPNATYTSFTMTNASTASGYLALVCGTPGNYIYALNNVNDDSKSYNKEPDATLAHNLLWNDDRFLNFFTVTNTAYTKGYWPDMIMNADAPMFSYVNLSAANDLQLRRGDPTVAVPNPDPGSLCRGLAFTSASFAKDDDGRYYHMAVHNMSNGRLQFFFDSYASNYMTNIGAGYTSYNGASNPYWATYPAGGNHVADTTNNAIDLDGLDYGGATVLDRYRPPKIVAKGSSTAAASSAASVYMVYYDDSTKELLFRSFQVGRLNTLGTTMGSVGGNTVYTNLPNQTSASPDNTRKLVAASASQYYDMVVTTDNYVVIVYFDAAQSKLMLVRSAAAVTGANPTAAVTWNGPYPISSDYVGTYVSMVRDGTNQLHLAAYDAGFADLKYIFIPDSTLTDFSTTGKTEVTVDSAQSIGLWADIKLVAGVPYISYYNNSENGTHDSIKLAWYKGAAPSAGTRPTAGVDASGNVSGTWETMTVPVNTVPQGSLPQFKRVDLGIRTDSTPLVAYLGDQIEYVRMYPSL